MGALAGAFIKAGNEYLVPVEDASADRAKAFTAVLLQAVNAAPDVHEAILSAVQRGKRRGTYQLPWPQFCRADRAGLRVAGHAFAGGFKASFTAITPAAKPSQGGNTNGKKKRVAKPKQGNAYKQKNKYLKKLFH